MTNHNRLTNIKKDNSDLLKILDAVIVSVIFLALCWAVFLTEEYLDFGLRKFGMHPRSIEGIPGIITMHFLHGDWQHIIQNSLGFLVLNTFLFYFYRQIAFRVLFIVMLVSPVFVWLFARDSNHIGASLIIYGEFAFLAISGFIRSNPQLLRVALVVVTYYGSLVWYLFPIEERISFEGHLSGFVVGLAAAIILRKSGPQRIPYRFELEPELPDDENAYWKIPSPEASTNDTPTTVTVKYHYKENEEEKENNTSPKS